MSWLSRLKHALRPQDLDRDLSDEINDHLERRAADYRDRGEVARNARARAALVFGNVTAIREQSRSIKASTTIESLIHDARHAARLLARRPLFALTAILSLSLAAGATTAMYSLVHATMLRRLPVPRPAELVTLSTSGPRYLAMPSDGREDLFSYPLYEALRTASGGAMTLALFDDPHRAEVQSPRNDVPGENVVSQFISPDAFDILGVPPEVGTLFSRSEDHYPSPRAVVVLSYDYWFRRYGADPAAIGTRLMVDGRPCSILGVTRAGFRGVEPGKFVDIWRPITTFDPSVFTNPAFRSFRLLGRLDRGTTREQLRARLQPTFQRHQETIANRSATSGAAASLRATTLVVRSGEHGMSSFRQTFARPLWILLGVAGGILVMACINVAGLLLARSRVRTAELALRVSLGAGRARLFRQVIAESLLISAIGAVGGWMLAHGLANVLVARVSSSVDPIRLDLTFGAPVLAFTLGLCVLSTLVVAAIPAWQVTKIQPAEALRGWRRHVSHTRAGRVVVGMQIAIACCLVTSGAAFLYSFRNLTSVTVGFDRANVTVLTVANSLGPTQRSLQLELSRELQTNVSAHPKIQSAAVAWWAMFSGARRAQHVVMPGQPASEREELFYRVAPAYLETLRIPLLSGRDFDNRDTDDEPVPAIVNRAFAMRYFGVESPLGREFRRDDGVRHQVVGVAGDSHYDGLHNGPEPIVYMPMKPPGVFTLYVRSPLDAGTVAAIVAGETAALGSGMRVTDVTTLSTLVGDAIVTERLLANVGGGCAVLSLLLAAIGLFGLLNYSVTERTQEIGIRTALGADRRGIYALILRDVGLLIASGVVAGLASAFVIIHAARSFLFGVSSADPAVIGISVATFLTTALVACAVPARRAAAIDPIIALRQD